MSRKGWLGGALVLMAVALAAVVWAMAGRGPEDSTARRVKVGERFTVELEGNITTGYGWEVAALDEGLVVQEGEVAYESAATGLAGAGGAFTFTFRAVAPGETTIELVYRRPWEKDVAPLQRQVVEVTVR